MHIPKNAKFKWFKWQKNLVHSFNYILYQPKGVPTPRDNFSGTGSMYTFFFLTDQKIQPLIFYLKNLKKIPIYTFIWNFTPIWKYMSRAKLFGNQIAEWKITFFFIKKLVPSWWWRDNSTKARQKPFAPFDWHSSLLSVMELWFLYQNDFSIVQNQLFNACSDIEISEMLICLVMLCTI